jgi:hypothetical protein
VAGDTTSWTPPTLDAAEEYFWRVRAKVGSNYGGYSQELRSFFTLPYCTSADLMYMPSLVSPPYGDIFQRGYDSLEWEWPISTCIPESYRVELATDPDFIDTSLNGATGSPGTRWGPGDPLDPATQYFWRITPFGDSTFGLPSITSSFFTDPICLGSSLITPLGLTPADWETVTTANPNFTWDYSDTSCSPEGIHLQISTEPDFSTIFIDADNPTSASREMAFGYPLNDCDTYFWRVAVVSEGVESPYSTPHMFNVDLTDSCTCDPGSIPVPELTAPDPFEIVPDLTPSLQWTNPGDCFPEGYAIALSTNYDLSGPNLGGGASYPYTSWGPATPLDPGTQYYWKVRGGVGTTFGEYSSLGRFFTGPECTSLTEVMAPVLLYPVDGAVVDTLTPVLHYRPGDPACIPDGYLADLHTLADLSDPNLLGEYSLPATTVITDPLTNCTLYYWMITGVQGGGYGPPSEIWSFYVDVDGTCPPPALPGTARKNGFCRTGTYPEYFPAIHTFEEGDPVLAVARNFFNTYLLMIVTDKSGQPILPLDYCWSIKDLFDFGDDSEKKVFSLPIEDPPPTPIPTLTPTPTLQCHSKLGPTDCKDAGGTYDTGKKYCDCP